MGSMGLCTLGYAHVPETWLPSYSQGWQGQQVQLPLHPQETRKVPSPQGAHLSFLHQSNLSSLQKTCCMPLLSIHSLLTNGILFEKKNSPQLLPYLWSRQLSPGLEDEQVVAREGSSSGQKAWCWLKALGEPCSYKAAS